jgi:hypothetical protein
MAIEKNQATAVRQAATRSHRPGQTDSNPPDDTPAAAHDNPGGLVRVTVNLTPKSANSLEHISRTTGLSKTDVINRSLQVYQVVEELLDKGKGSILIKHPSGELERVYIL